MNDRDERLGHQLRALDVPDHRPDFFARLTDRLDQDTPPDHGRRPRGPRPPMLLVMAVAAVVLALVGLSTQFTGNGASPIRKPPGEPKLISATEVRSRVSTALASLRSLSGEVTIECTEACPFRSGGPRSNQQWSFVTTAAGDERVTGIGHTDDFAYSATRRELRTVTQSGSRVSAQILSNLAPGPPDFGNQFSVLHRNVASVVRAFLDTTGDVPVTDVTEQDRPAWRLVTPVVPNKLAGPGLSADEIEVVVDRQTGFPLRITETLAGAFLDEVRLSNLVVDGPVDPGSFTLEPPAGVQPIRQDRGFRAVSIDQVEAIVGYPPVLPTPASLPPGYVRAEVTVATDATTPGTEGQNAPSPRVVSVAYRRGFDRIVVTTRSTGAAKACTPTSHFPCWADPIASGEGTLDVPEPFTVGAGALAGAQANVVIAPQGVPHVWTIDDRLVATIAGDANAVELHRMAESFAPAS